MMFFSKTPFQLAWGWMKEVCKGEKKKIEDVIVCPDCEMPLDLFSGMREINLRVEEAMGVKYRILSCPWCYGVYNLGPLKEETK